jgi:hypothetical protein
MKGPFLKDLYVELEAAKDRLRAEHLSYLHNSEYKAKQAELDALRDRLCKESEPRAERIKAEIEDLKRQIVEVRDGRDKITPAKWPEWLQEFIKEISSGVDWGTGPTGGSRWWMLRWVSQDQRFVILTRPGGDFWHGVGLKSYGPAYHWLVDRDKFLAWKKSGEGRHGIGAGIRLSERCSVIQHEGGRLSAFRRAQMIEKAKEIAA